MARLNYKEVLKGDKGTTYEPHVTIDGTLYWTNKDGLPNPLPVNIKGKDGDMVQNNEIDKINKKIENIDENIHDIEIINKIRTNRTGINKNKYLTIIDDDGRKELYTKIRPILNKHNLKISIAINPKFIGTNDMYLTWEEVKTMQNEGHEIINHGWIGKEIENMTIEELEKNFINEKEKFIEKDLGEGYNYFVYSGVQPAESVDVKNKIKKFYKCSFANYISPQSFIPFDEYEIKRFPIQLGNKTKEYIDFCYNNNAYCVLMCHSYIDEINEEYLNDIIQYIKKKNFTIKQAIYMVDKYKNQISLGNTGGDYFFLDENGNVDFSINKKSINEIYNDVDVNNKKIEYREEYFNDNTIDEYNSNTITVEVIEHSKALAMGFSDAGLIITHRWYYPTKTEIKSFIKQEFKCFNKNEIWLRTWNGQYNRWNLFTPLNSLSLKNKPKYAETGYSYFDINSNKLLCCKKTGYSPNVTIARNKAFNKWDVVYIPQMYAHAICLKGGMTSNDEPSWNVGSGKKTNDGDVVWEYVGGSSEWITFTGN